MIHWKRALILALLSWLIPFAISFVVFPLKRVNAPLFETVMGVTLVVTAALLTNLYARRTKALGLGEGAVLGCLWLAANLVLDYPMFSYGPMQMTAAQYYSEIGADYLIYPAFTMSAATLVRNLRA